MSAATFLRVAALLCVVAAVVAGLGRRGSDAVCGTDLGACRNASAPACGRDLGDWRVARSRTAGLPAARSHSACVRADGVVSVVPQPPDVSGDTLVAREGAARRDAQRATVRLDVVGSLPDHWAFGVGGTFLDVDTPHACDTLPVRLPVNAAYALIGGNWQSRPHGFYFERLTDACVYDGTDPDCPGEYAFVAHEFRPGETFVLDLTLHAVGGAHWLDAEITTLAPASGGDGAVERPRSLGRMRQRVAAPCWLAPGATGSALIVVIPDPDPNTHAPGSRVDVSRFAWLAPQEAR